MADSRLLRNRRGRRFETKLNRPKRPLSLNSVGACWHFVKVIAAFIANYAIRLAGSPRLLLKLLVAVMADLELHDPSGY
jgi:hypothetical protein